LGGCGVRHEFFFWCRLTVTENFRISPASASSLKKSKAGHKDLAAISDEKMLSWAAVIYHEGTKIMISAWLAACDDNGE
jgi:hypothetical protein